jgi:hypothetical protein
MGLGGVMTGSQNSVILFFCGVTVFFISASGHAQAKDPSEGLALNLITTPLSEDSSSEFRGAARGGGGANGGGHGGGHGGGGHGGAGHGGGTVGAHGGAGHGGGTVGGGHGGSGGTVGGGSHGGGSHGGATVGGGSHGSGGHGTGGHGGATVGGGSHGSSHGSGHSGGTTTGSHGVGGSSGGSTHGGSAHGGGSHGSDNGGGHGGGSGTTGGSTGGSHGGSVGGSATGTTTGTTTGSTHGGGGTGGGSGGGGTGGGGAAGGGGSTGGATISGGGTGGHGGGTGGGGTGGTGGGGGTVGTGGTTGGGTHGGGVDPHKPVEPIEPTHTVKHEEGSYLDNPLTQNNIGYSRSHLSLVNYSATSKNLLKEASATFKSEYSDLLQKKLAACESYYQNEHYRYYYSAWFDHGFCGGFYYPVRSWSEIESYFSYPVIYWFYVDAGPASANLAHQWFFPKTLACEFSAFEFTRAYFPTDAFKDLGLDVSGLGSDIQCSFMKAINVATRSLRDQLSAQVGASIRFDKFEIFVNHYANLGNEGIEIQGFVDRSDIQQSFKVLLDLRNPAATTMFVPSTQGLNAVDLNQLDDQSAKIRSLGGNPDVVDLEPDQVEGEN